MVAAGRPGDVVRCDVAVVGAGPAGSIAALELARAGARVALIDKAAFPRDKACGDLVGPRGVRLLDELRLAAGGPDPVGDMLVVGPTGRSARLPAYPGRAYADHGIVAPRRQLDAALRAAAIDAGARPIRGRLCALDRAASRTSALVLTGGPKVVADVTVGADGARGVLGELAGLTPPQVSLWAFAIRGYLPAAVRLPVVCLLDDSAGRAFPGYGWLFPGLDGAANVGIGMAVGTRRSAIQLTRLPDLLRRFVGYLARRGLLDQARQPSQVQGGWLRLGGAGARAAGGDVLLAGDAAALVNPLQGEGIAPAMRSGQLAAAAILAGPATAAARYRGLLAAAFGPYFAVATPLHRAMLGHPRAVAVAARTLTSPVVRRTVAGAWSLSWNDLVDGATPRPSLAVARLGRWAGTVVADRAHAEPRPPAGSGVPPAELPVP